MAHDKDGYPDGNHKIKLSESYVLDCKCLPLIPLQLIVLAMLLVWTLTASRK